MSGRSKWEYLRKIHPRYQEAPAVLKQRILDEFCSNCGYHRKHAIRLLNGPLPREGKPRRSPRRRSYGSRLISVLSAIWEAAGYPWSVRLKAILPVWMPWTRKRFSLSPALERQLLRISARTIDYRLQDRKRRIRKRLYGHTKPGTLLKHHIPLKTDAWDVRTPGFTEVDLVSHSGECASGEYCYSLNMTDIHTTWVETRVVMGKGQQGVCEAMEEMRRALPFPLLGIDSDNGSEFINRHLLGYCRNLNIQFTRGRPYKKDDNAHIEQKNWTHVRRVLGYERYDSPAAFEAIQDLYRHELRLFQNLFLPSLKLLRKVRVGSRLRRVYSSPQTPFQRLRSCSQADPAKVATLETLLASLDPFELSQTIEKKLDRIYHRASRTHPNPTPRSTVSTTFHRLPQKEKSTKKERENDDDE
ncbi:MAG: integrase [Candidatus Omnitrophota bacterium]|nr:integrase [Candidatus Omnitrophota bacterium]